MASSASQRWSPSTIFSDQIPAATTATATGGRARRGTAAATAAPSTTVMPSASSTPNMKGLRHRTQSSASPIGTRAPYRRRTCAATRRRDMPRSRRLVTNRAIDAPAATKNATAAASVTLKARQPGRTTRASPVCQSVRWCTSMATSAMPRRRSSASDRDDVRGTV
jgi:hypothetical protein